MRLEGYPYFKHIIQLWPGDWVKHMANMNEAGVVRNHFTVNGGGKRLVRPFNRQELYKFIVCILSAVTYGKKGHKIWIEIPKYSCRMAPLKLQRDIRVNTNLYKVCCSHYCHFHIYACH